MWCQGERVLLCLFHTIILKGSTITVTGYIDLGILIRHEISPIAIDSKHLITRRTRFVGLTLTPTSNSITSIGITWITTSARVATGILPSPSHSSTGVCAFAFYPLTTHLSVKEFSSMQLVMDSRFPY